MATNILVPELGESVLEATVSRWLKQEGDSVSVGDVLVELETDKVNLEVGAKSAGVLAKIEVPEGGDVKVGEVLGTIDENEQQPVAAANAAAPQPQAAQTELPDADGKSGGQPETRPITPVASRLVRENNLDISRISGSGPDGRVTKADVEQYLREQEKLQTGGRPAGAQDAANATQTDVSQAEASIRHLERPAGMLTQERSEDRIRMSRRRRTIAERLLQAQQGTAMLTTFNEIDMSGVVDLRRRRSDEFQKRHGVKLGYTSFFVKASISALKAFPRLNAEIQDDEIVLKHYYDIGMAIGSEDGLVVPVIRGADRLTFAEIEQQVKELVARTDQGKLTIEDLRGGTFTITNGGVFGSLLSTPILNPPQVGILGMHKIEERPVAINGQVVIRPMMYVALSYDHRIVDGREAVQFLVHVKQMVEEPGFLLVNG